MSEYIEREAVLSRIKTLQETDSATVGKKQFADGYFLGLDESEIITRQAPTVNVVEVVKCKDCIFCKYNEDADVYKCDRRGYFTEYVNPDDYCSKGERNA